MGDIDFSSEALAERIVSEGEPDGVEEAVEEPATDTVDEAGSDAEPAAEVDEAEGEATEEPAAEDEPGVDEPHPAEARYQEAQKLIGRQGQELGELRKMVEAMQAQSAPQPEPVQEQPVFQGRTPQTQNELLEMAATPEEAVEAYQFAVSNAIDLLPEVIAEVEAYDPALAKRMEMDYYAQMVQSQYAPLQQSFHQATMAQQQAQVVSQIAQTIPGFDDMREDIAKIVEEEPDLMGDGSPEAVARGLKWAARMAQQVKDHAAQQVAQQAQQASVAQRQQAAVESGTPSSAPAPVEHSEADLIRSAIFAQDQARRDLF